MRAQSGDRDAFEQLARPLTDRLYAIAYRILRNGPSAEDATQQAMLLIWRQLPKLRDPDRFDAWAYRLLTTAAYKEYHRRRNDPPADEIVDVAGYDPYASVANRDQLERGFARLSVEQRAVLVLQHYLSLSHDEMAEVLAVPVGTVRSRLHGARRAMRAALEADARPASNRSPA
jgi:RNA polymerase sigma-70 factor (ECF subfamily)